MRCQKRVKAGVMLYALLMMAVFALLLQFYLNRQIAAARIHQASRDSLTAYAMAVWTKDKIERKLSETSDGSGSPSNQEQSSERSETDKSSENETEAGSRETVQSAQNFSTPAASSQEKTSKGSTGQDQPSLEKKQKAEQSASSSSEKVVKKTDSGQISFKEGQAVYQQEGAKLTVAITLSRGAEFHYQFSIFSENS